MKNRKDKKRQPKKRKQTTNGRPAAATPKTPKSAKPAPAQKHTIKQVVIDAFAANNVITNDELIAAVKAQFPESAFKDSHASWYRSQARKGLLTGTPIEIPALRQSRSGS